MNQLSTIGYERAALDDFIATLQLCGVTTLLDVRELPVSRRRGFAKNALRDALEDHGIQYIHERRLGSPKTIRDQLKNGSWDYEEFFSRYDEHLTEHENLLHALVSELDGHVALMCYERDHKQCHRSSVASALERLTGLKTWHIGVQGEEQRKAYEASHSNSRKGVSSA